MRSYEAEVSDYWTQTIKLIEQFSPDAQAAIRKVRKEFFDALLDKKCRERELAEKEFEILH